VKSVAGIKNSIRRMLGREKRNWGTGFVILVVLAVSNAGAQALPSTQDNSAPKAATPNILSTVDVLKPEAGNSEGKNSEAKRGDISSAALTGKVIEDFLTPSLKTSDLMAAEPLVGQVDTSDPTYTLELTRLQWRAADPIDLFIMKPTGVTNPPVILYLYSYPTDNEVYLKSDFRKFLTKNGFAAVGFVSALTGERYHAPRPMKEWFVSELPEALASSAHDVQMILNYLVTRQDLDMDRVGMFGEGSGATIAILAAAADARIKTLDLVNPWCDWPDWSAKTTMIPENERATLLKSEFLAAVAHLDPVKWLPELKTEKIRLRDVNSDAVTPAEARKKLEAVAVSNVEVVRYDDLKAFRGAISGGAAFDWIKQQMQAGKAEEYRPAGQTQAKGINGPAKE
jgi:hypothetical protein